MERFEFVLLAATARGDAGAPRQLCHEQSSTSLLPELLSRFSKEWDLAFDLFAEISDGVVCLTLLRHRVFVQGMADLECFRPANDAVLRQFANAALYAGPDDELSGGAAEAANRVAFLMGEATIANTLWSPTGELPLYQCMTRGVLSFLLWLLRVLKP